MKSRKRWGARPTKPSQDYTAKKTFVVHHSAAFGRSIDTVKEQKAAMRLFQNYHMDNNGWDDIGYLGVVFQPNGRLRRSRAYVGRHNDQSATFIGRYLPAAQASANSGTIPICVAGNFEVEGVKEDTIRKLVTLAKKCREEFGTTHLAGHGTDFGGTACPGDHLEAKLDEIAKRSGLKRGRA